MRKRSDAAPAVPNPPAPADQLAARAAGVVRDVSAELAEQVERAGREAEDAAQEASDYKFRSAHRRQKEKPIRADLADIVESVFVHDMKATWARLKDGLRVGERRSDHATLLAALDEAEARAHDAHRLMITAKMERDRWEAENEPIHGAMWGEASRSLQADKDSGRRSKQVTDADVRAKCATLFPDEWREQESKRRAVKLTVDSLENLAECWMSRCRSLQAMLAKLRG